MKDIKSALNDIKRCDDTFKKICKFIKTKRGLQFVSKLHSMPYYTLCKMYQVPACCREYNNSRKDKNMILSAIKEVNLTIPKVHTAEFEFVNPGKFPVYLTKKELRKINSHKPSKKMGFAERMHAYEEQKMKKFIAKHPAPTEEELAQDLFPKELIAGYNNMLYIRREYVRNFLCKVYAGTTPKEEFYRMFTVLSITEDPATGKKHDAVVSEVETDPNIVGKPFAGLDEKASNETLRDILARMATIVHNADKNAIKVKLYNKYGSLLHSCKCVQ